MCATIPPHALCVHLDALDVLEDGKYKKAMLNNK
jgi:hypothetical protein